MAKGENIIFLYTPEYEKNGYPDACPFNSHRAGKTREMLQSMGMLGGNGRSEAAPVTAARDDLERFHVAAYLDAIRKAEQGDLSPAAFAMGLGTPDCPVFKGMYDHAALTCGASLTGMRHLLAGSARAAFNPAGGYHHAMPARAAGFCYMNDVVLACMLAAEAGHKVLFLDIDVHHCDGVQHAFNERRDVLTVSLHESGNTLFPGTGFEADIGEGEGRGFSVNIPLPVGAYDAVYLKAFREAALPVMEAYAPDMIVLELGMDALSGDPLAHLHLTNNVHADIIGRVMKFGKPILVTGGGGYHIENTVRGWALAWSVLCGDQSYHDDMVMGMGGVMLENTDWTGGLRDRVLLSDAGKRSGIDREVREVIGRVRKLVFPLHGLA